MKIRKLSMKKLGVLHGEEMADAMRREGFDGHVVNILIDADWRTSQADDALLVYSTLHPSQMNDLLRHLARRYKRRYGVAN